MTLTFLDLQDQVLARMKAKRVGSVYYWWDATKNDWQGSCRTKEALFSAITEALNLKDKVASVKVQRNH